MRSDLRALGARFRRAMFPREVLEHILLHCDGRTLKTSADVSRGWRLAVEYLAEKYNLWKQCVHKDIPRAELQQYKSKWMQLDEANDLDWEKLYENWLSWTDIRQNVTFHQGIVLKMSKISCIASMGDFIAVGLTNGMVRVFHKNGDALKPYRHLIVQVQSLHFIPDFSSANAQPKELLIVYDKRVYIIDFLGSYDHCVYDNAFIFSNYKQYICGVSAEGRVTISRLVDDDVRQRKSYELVTFVRIYSPEVVKSCALGDGVCTLLVNDKVKLINYKEGSKSSHFMAVELTQLQFSIRNSNTMRRDVFHLHDKVIVAVTKSLEDIMRQQIFELFIMHDGEKEHSKKMFIPWRVFYALISCVHLYGNTLILGMSSGYVYFYVIEDWKLFDIADYAYSLPMPELEPIVSIDVVENYGERHFYIAGNTFVCRWTGQTVKALKMEYKCDYQTN